MSSKNTKWNLLASNALEGFGPQMREEKAKYKVKLSKDAMFVKEMKVNKIHFKNK